MKTRAKGKVQSAKRKSKESPACATFALCTLHFAFCLAFSLGCSRPSEQPKAAPLPRFREAAAETGLAFIHFTGATGKYYMPEIMGAGAALFDYDGDGDLDVCLIQGTMLEADKKPLDAKFPPPAGWKPGNRLFRNELVPSGQLRFTDVTEQAGVGHVGTAWGRR